MQGRSITPNSSSVSVNLYGSGQDPLEPKLGGIKWNMTVHMDTSVPSKPSAWVDYTHTCYPPQVKALIPLAQRCLMSDVANARRKGLFFLMATSFRPDSSSLLEPVLDDLESIASDPKSALRLGALYVLGSMNPGLSAKAVAYLKKQLDDTTHATDEQRTIAASLVQASQPNPALLPEVLAYSKRNLNPTVRIGVIGQLVASHIWPRRTKSQKLYAKAEQAAPL